MRSEDADYLTRVERAVAVKKGEKASRTRFSWRGVLRSVGGVAAVATVVFSGLVAFDELRTSSRFAISGVHVSGQRHADPDSIRALAGVALGTNVFSVDLDRVRQRVTSHPWVASAVVRRELPRGLRIRVREHRPFALVREPTLHFVDRRGGYLKPYAPGDPADFPVVGFEGERDRGEWRERGLVRALAAVEAWNAAPLAELSEIRVRPSGRLEFRTASGWRVHGWPPIQRRSLERLQLLQKRLTGVEEVFLEGTRRPDQMVVAVRGGSDA
jgi:cell division protein FtsQ